MTQEKAMRVYCIVVRICFSMFFALMLYVTLLVFREDYNENYYTGLNIGFTFSEYLLKYPTETVMPLLLVLALLGMIFRWKIGWIVSLALVVGLIFKSLWNIPAFFPVVGVLIGALSFIMLLQLRGHFAVKPGDFIWSAAVVAAFAGLLILEDHGGFLARPLPQQ